MSAKLVEIVAGDRSSEEHLLKVSAKASMVQSYLNLAGELL